MGAQVRRGLPRTPEGTEPLGPTGPGMQRGPSLSPPDDTSKVSMSGRRQGLPRTAAPPVVSTEVIPEETNKGTPERSGKQVAARPGAGRLKPLLWGGALIVVGALAVVLSARWFVSLAGVQDFLQDYPGETDLPESAPVGIPAWMGWQHFFNVFLMVLIIRSGLQVRTERRPAAYWTPRWGNNPRKMSLTLWFHQLLDVLWLVNGVVFVVLLFATGQWMRVVPTSLDVFPNALSALLQYVSLSWPTENGWVNYNSLQVLTYFTTIFIAAPLAAITGVRMSSAWPDSSSRLNRLYPIDVARAIHFPVMIYFVAFIVVHVALVLSTGALRNLNHMYGGQDAVNWAGFWIFCASLAVIVVAWIAAMEAVLASIARLFGKVGR